MQQLKLIPFAIAGLVGAFALVGCGSSVSFDTSGTFPATTTTTMSKPIQFSNFGGHAPIVGAKVFLLQAGQTGYGSKSTSILSNAVLSQGGGTDTTYVGSSGTPAYYVTTDGAGFGSITGDYTCTAGLPVYLYALGGAPDSNPAVGASNMSSASLTSDGTYLTETFIVDNEKFYVGQQVTFANIPAGNNFAGNNGQTFTVSAISTTDNKSFTIRTNNLYTGGYQGPFTISGTVTPIGVQNPGIVNTAMLGNCPSPFTISAQVLSGNAQFLTNISPSDAAKLTNANVAANSWQISGPGLPAGTTITFANVAGGTIVVSNADTNASGTPYTFTVTPPFTFGANSSSPISFIYMNEVSTAAMMFAMAPFAETSTISGGVVTRTGTDAQHIGIPASNSLALTGLQNAAVNAGQLYDITGGNVGTGCTPVGQCANGEAHVARPTVPNSGTGKGVATVPQSLIDTLGNILAACVDSNNLYGFGATGGTPSTQCKTLFQTATSDGKPVTSFGATTPLDTATAAINIAHYPAGNGASAGSFMSNLFGLQSGVVPFQPMLSTAPTDFVIGINITVPQGTNPTNYLGSSGTTPAAAIPTSIATNANGEAFVGTTGCGSGGAESATNGYGCVLQIEPTQLLPALPTVGGVGLVQGVKSVSVGPSGKVWATGTLETGQSVGGFTAPPGGFYVVQNAPSAANPITYGTANGALSTSYNFASYGNVSYNVNPGVYTYYYGQPTSIAVSGLGQAYIADTTKGYLHDVTGLASAGSTPPLSYTTTNYDSEYLIQGVLTNGSQTTNCQANISAVAIGPLTPATTSGGSGAYNIWSVSQGGNVTQGMCTIPNPNPTTLTPAMTNNPTVNTVTPISQLGPQYTVTSVAVDANDVGWDTNQGSNGANGIAEGFPDNGQGGYGGVFAFAGSNTTTPSGIAIDGNNNLWVTNLGSNSVSAYTSSGPVTGSGQNTTTISPAGTGQGNGDGGYKAGGTISGPSAIAVDISGDVWVANTSSSGVGYSVTELIGVAAPAYRPLAAAQAANKLGAKP
jgi:hypothetical protein